MATKKATNRMAPATRSDQGPLRVRLNGPEEKPTDKVKIGGVHLPVAGNTMSFYTGRVHEVSKDEYNVLVNAKLPPGYEFESVDEDEELEEPVAAPVRDEISAGSALFSKGTEPTPEELAAATAAAESGEGQEEESTGSTGGGES